MSNNTLDKTDPNDPTAESRKKDHITLAFASQTNPSSIDDRFYYEPMLSGHPNNQTDISLTFLSKLMEAPIWVSSMTGGTAKASTINKNLARMCGEYKLGMGLGSCRSLLHSEDHMKDFDVRHLMNDQPLYANLGIAQVEELITDNKSSLINEMIDKLQADGLIVHVNPMQEWLQPEGDRYYQSPIDTIHRLKDSYKGKIIVKEVGHGFGPESIKALLALEIDAIDFAANGGTNFSKIELSRTEEENRKIFEPLTFIGHSADEMVALYNEVAPDNSKSEVIISGGIKTYLDGYYLINKCKSKAIYGQASGFLRHAMGEYEELQQYVESQIAGLKVATAFLTIKDKNGKR
jgi:isopentenyl-diphosphate delta-isomerase